MRSSNICHTAICHTVLAAGAFVLAVGCAKSAPEADAPQAEAPVAAEAAPEAAPLATPQESEESYFVEGVAGGVMVRKLQLEAEVISVDQSKREAVLRGPEGNEVVVKVGENAVNFYQVAPGDRVDVTMARELAVYVPDDAQEEGVEEAAEEDVPDGTAVAAARAPQGERPAGVVVATTKVTAKVKALDLQERKATLVFEDGGEKVFDVRPDVDMTKYAVDQEVVFLITDLLALEVRKL